jgi:T4-like virus tail tube protein gp19
VPEFSVNPTRFDPYKEFKFRVKWDGRYVAGVTKVTALKRTTEVIEHREGGDPSTSRKSPGRTEFEAITLVGVLPEEPEAGTPDDVPGAAPIAEKDQTA